MSNQIEKYKLPSGWVWTNLEDISIPVKKINRQYQDPNEEFLYIDIDAVDNKTFRVTNPKKLTWSEAPSRAQQQVIANDILISNVRPYLKNIALVPTGERQIASSGFCVIRPSVVNPKYLYYYFLNQEFIDSINKLAKGTSYPAVTNGVILQQMVALPPIEEQKRIVEKIEEIFSEIEKSKEQLENSFKLLSVFRQSILMNAFEGNLTTEWRSKRSSLKTSNELLNEINSYITNYNKAQVEDFISGKQLKKRKTQPFAESQSISSTGKLTDIPSNWCRISLENISEKITDGTHHTPEYKKTGIHFISVKDIFSERIHFENTRYIDKSTHNELIKRCNPEAGDILMTKSGTIGRLAIVPNEPEFSLFVSVALIKPYKKIIDSKYLKYALEDYINSIDIKQDIKGAVIKNFHLEDIRIANIPYCTIEEQIEIVSEIENKISIASELEKSLIETLDLINSLQNTILEKAFKGDLVSQYSNDEHARVLVESTLRHKEFLRNKKNKIGRVKNITLNNMSVELKRILDILEERKGPVPSKELWQLSVYKEDIDGFYAEIKKHIESGEVVELPRMGKESFLILAHTK